MTPASIPFRTDPAFARELDGADPLRSFRDQFHIPRTGDGVPVAYFAGNSLGLMPRDARGRIEQELDDWARLAVDGHFEAKTPWYSYHEVFRDGMARIAGARPDEVVVMNSLTANLHLMMMSFYEPRGDRRKILIDAPTFPSDLYAVRSQLSLRGCDPVHDLVIVEPDPGRQTITEERIRELLDTRGHEIALTLLSGVNYYTGQAFDIGAITERAHAAGALAGWDLAHAAGNIALNLHDWNVDFAAWCGYKYLNGGPGTVAGCFVHERHGREIARKRLAGWWGNDPATRFRMHLEPEFIPKPGADGWQLSNPPILALAPLKASLEIFDAATLPRLRARSERLTGYLEFLIDALGTDRFEIITPRDPARRGCQLSLFVKNDPESLFAQLKTAGIVCDMRKPNVIRAAPVPLYNSFEDVRRFAEVLKGA